MAQRTERPRPDEPRRHRPRQDEPLITRQEMAGWVDGPGGSIQRGRWPGDRLGLPESGPASLARPMRRTGALLIDWFLAYGLAAWLFGAHPMAVLALFAAMHVIGLSLLATTVGKAVVRIQVVRVGGASATFLNILVRTALLVLVLPLMIVDPDGRSLHDKAAGTVEIRM